MQREYSLIWKYNTVISTSESTSVFMMIRTWIGFGVLLILLKLEWNHLVHVPNIKATVSVYKLIPKTAQMTTLYTNWSLYITFTMIYCIRQE